MKEKTLLPDNALRKFFEDAYIGIHWVSKDGIIIQANQAILDLLGYRKDEYTGHHIGEFYVAQSDIENLLSSLAHGIELRQWPARMRRRDGTIANIILTAAPCFEGEQAVNTICFTRDVTVQNGAEILQEQLASIIDTSEDAIISKSLKGIILTWNTGAERIFGYSAGEAIGQSINLIIPPARRDEERNILEHLKHGKRVEHYETVRLKKSGEEINISLTVSPIRSVSGEIIGASKVARDISIRSKVEETQARLAAIVDSSDDAIISKTLDGIIKSWNAGAERLFGYTQEEAIGHSIELIIPPDRLDEERFILSRLRQGERIDHFETVRKTKDGRDIHISLTVSPVRDSSGKIIGASKIARDITERKATEEAIQESARLKDEFLAILAHELRNPLAPVRNSLEIMKRAEGDPEIIEQSRSTMDKQIAHMERIVDDLLDISRINSNQLELRLQTVDLASGIHHAIETCRPLAERCRHNVTVTLPIEPVYIHGDSVRLAQVFGNLLNNACKYTPPNGQISLAVERIQDDVAVTVKDNGNGIPAEMLPRIFDMFTQKERSLDSSQSGLGIGLGLVKRLVGLHGGTVQARSEGLGQGSEFIVRLPMKMDAGQIEKPPVIITDNKTSIQHRVLVVDDQEENAISLATLLNILGHDTKIAYNGVEAIATAEEFRPHIIFLDIGMPLLNGFDTCRRMRDEEWGADIVIVALTGWGQEEDRRKTMEAGFNYHLVKPVSLPALTEVLTSVASK